MAAFKMNLDVTPGHSPMEVTFQGKTYTSKVLSVFQAAEALKAIAEGTDSEPSRHLIEDLLDFTAEDGTKLSFETLAECGLAVTVLEGFMLAREVTRLGTGLQAFLAGQNETTQTD